MQDRKVELIVHNGHAWGKDLHFPASRQVHIYEGDVWQAIRQALALANKSLVLTAAVVAREKNSWKLTPTSFADDIQKDCVEHGHGFLWNAS